MSNKIFEKGFYYYVEVFDAKSKTWKAEVRKYLVKQDVSKFPDNKSRRNFKYLENQEAYDF